MRHLSSSPEIGATKEQIRPTFRWHQLEWISFREAERDRERQRETEREGERHGEGRRERERGRERLCVCVRARQLKWVSFGSLFGFSYCLFLSLWSRYAHPALRYACQQSPKKESDYCAQSRLTDIGIRQACMPKEPYKRAVLTQKRPRKSRI